MLSCPTRVRNKPTLNQFTFAAYAEPTPDNQYCKIFFTKYTEGTNAMFWRFDCDGGDECEWSLAGSAAYVRDVKPESDVHSNLSKQRSLWKTMASILHFFILIS